MCVGMVGEDKVWKPILLNEVLTRKKEAVFMRKPATFGGTASTGDAQAKYRDFRIRAAISIGSRQLIIIPNVY